MNQKIVVAISIIAIVLSLVNLTISLLPKSANGSINLSFSSTPQNLYVANVTAGSSQIITAFIVNPTSDYHYYECSEVMIEGNQTVSDTSFRSLGVSYIAPHTTQPLLLEVANASLCQKVEISIFDTLKGFVYDETLDIIHQS